MGLRQNPVKLVPRDGNFALRGYPAYEKEKAPFEHVVRTRLFCVPNLTKWSGRFDELRMSIIEYALATYSLKSQQHYLVSCQR